MLHPVFLRQPGPRWFGGRSTKNFLLPATPWRHRHEQVRGLEPRCDRAVIRRRWRSTCITYKMYDVSTDVA
jgi:hypothetical protein